MAISSLLPVESAALPALDLKWSLMLRVVAAALICFLAAAAFALVRELSRYRQGNEICRRCRRPAAAGPALPHRHQHRIPARFPDWDPVSERVQSAGQCIQFIWPDGSVGRSNCVGVNSGTAARRRGSPPWAIAPRRARRCRAPDFLSREISGPWSSRPSRLPSSPRSGRTLRGCSA